MTHRISKLDPVSVFIQLAGSVGGITGTSTTWIHTASDSLRRTLQLRHHRTNSSNMTDPFLTETIHRSPNRWMNLALAKDHLDPLAACHSLAQRSFHSISALNKDELQ